MKLRRAQDRLEALKKTSVGAKALADVTAEVGSICVQTQKLRSGVVRWAGLVMHYNLSMIITTVLRYKAYLQQTCL